MRGVSTVKLKDHVSLTVVKVAVVVGDALGQVEVTLLVVALLVAERGTEDRDGAVALDGEVDVLSGAGKVLAVPVEVACRLSAESRRQWSSQTHRCRCRRTG